MQTPLLLAILAASTPLLITLLSSINYYWDYVQNSFSPDASAEIYDFIIVGAGSSGSVVAYRLASQNYKVLLIEAGGDPILFSSIPGIALDLIGYKEHDWDYKSVPQDKVALSHRNKQFNFNRGKVLGGTSTLNFMMYLRGHPLDYENWANITGDPEWNYDSLLPFFRKSILKYAGNFKENKKHYESSPYGFLTIEKMSFDKMVSSWNGAAEELGYKGNLDINGPQGQGAGCIEVTQRNGERCSTYAAIFQGRTHKTLRISKYSQATKVKFDKRGRAVGIWYYRHGKKYLAKASKEIVLSGGAYDSPKLLLLSGIGPKQELEALRIKSRGNLPVGKNLHDHFGIFIMPFITKEGSSFMLERDFGVGQFYEYLTQGTGFLTIPCAMTGQFFYTSSKVQGKDWPDVQAFLVPAAPSKLLAQSFARGLSLNSEIFEEILVPHHGRDGFALLIAAVRPKSRGQLRLKDNNPFSDPLIDPRPYSHPDDMEVLIQGVNATFRLIEETSHFRELEAKFEGPHFSHCQSHPFRSNAYWECYIRHLSLGIWHPVGTCKMGGKVDPTSVVDSKLRVLGTRGLRVVDASIMPTIVNANTNAPSILIGEKGADMILDYWATQKLVCNIKEHLRYSDDSKCFYA